MTTNYAELTTDSFEELKSHLKSLKVKDHDRCQVLLIVKLYGALSLCVDVIRGLNGDNFISEQCDLPIDEMIRKIEKYAKKQNYDNSKEAQIHRYVALYHEIYAKIFNLLHVLN